MDQAVQGGKVRAVYTQQVICIACHRPCTCDLGMGIDHAYKTAGLVRVVRRHLDLNKGLHMQAQFGGIQSRCVACNQAFLFKALSPPPRLAWRQAKLVAKVLRGQMGIFLNRRQKSFVDIINHAQNMHENGI